MKTLIFVPDPTPPPPATPTTRAEARRALNTLGFLEALGVWLLMGSVAGAAWIVNRWNRWWVWGIVSVMIVILAAVALEFITIVEEF
jgi:hypothetical protein